MKVKITHQVLCDIYDIHIYEDNKVVGYFSSLKCDFDLSHLPIVIYLEYGKIMADTIEYITKGGTINENNEE